MANLTGVIFTSLIRVQNSFDVVVGEALAGEVGDEFLVVLVAGLTAFFGDQVPQELTLVRFIFGQHRFYDIVADFLLPQVYL